LSLFIQNHQGGNLHTAVHQAGKVLWWTGLVVSRYKCAISSGTANTRRLQYILFWYKAVKLGQLSRKMCQRSANIHPAWWPEYFTKGYRTLQNV